MWLISLSSSCLSSFTIDCKRIIDSLQFCSLVDDTTPLSFNRVSIFYINDL